MSSQLADEIRPDRSRNKIHSASSLSDKIDSTEKIGTRRSACGFSYHNEKLYPVFE